MRRGWVAGQGSCSYYNFGASINSALHLGGSFHASPPNMPWKMESCMAVRCLSTCGSVAAAQRAQLGQLLQLQWADLPTSLLTPVGSSSCYGQTYQP